LSFKHLVVADQMALGVDEIVRGPEILDLALGCLDILAQIIELGRQLVRRPSGHTELVLGRLLLEDVPRRIGDLRRLVGTLGGGADRNDKSLAAALDREALGQIGNRQRLTAHITGAARSILARQYRADERHDAKAAGALSVELRIVNEMEIGDDLVEDIAGTSPS